MPVYTFQKPDSDETTDLYYPIKDAPKVGDIVEVDGVKWRRVFAVPTAGVDTKIDPFSAKEFMDKTYAKRGTVGDQWDLSAELSAKRAEKEGVDPLKEKFFADWKRKRKGMTHPSQLAENQRKAKEKLEKGLAKLGLKIDMSKLGKLS